MTQKHAMQIIGQLKSSTNKVKVHTRLKVMNTDIGDASSNTFHN